MQPNTNKTKLAYRLSEILQALYAGEVLDIHQLSEKYSTSIRTLQRDLRDRLNFIDHWKQSGPRYFQLDHHYFQHLTHSDIERFARFASVSDLFPKIDREFYGEKLTQDVLVKGMQYESISHLQQEFQMVKNAIKAHCYLDFCYTKSGQKTGKFYKIAPYSLLNKNGIWYLIGTDNGKEKTFCFSQISLLKMLEEVFEPNEKLYLAIQENDSISHGNQISEVVIQISSQAAPYFQRRKLLPNQELVRKLDSGGLLLACRNVNEWDIVPLVQYWVPHLTVISPEDVQEKVYQNLNHYLSTK